MARLIRAVVDLVLKLEPTGFAVGVAVVAEGTTAMVDRLEKNPLDRAIQ